MKIDPFICNLDNCTNIRFNLFNKKKCEWCERSTNCCAFHIGKCTECERTTHNPNYNWSAL